MRKLSVSWSFPIRDKDSVNSVSIPSFSISTANYFSFMKMRKKIEDSIPKIWATIAIIRNCSTGSESTSNSTKPKTNTIRLATYVNAFLILFSLSYIKPSLLFFLCRKSAKAPDSYDLSEWLPIPHYTRHHSLHSTQIVSSTRRLSPRKEG